MQIQCRVQMPPSAGADHDPRVEARQCEAQPPGGERCRRPTRHFKPYCTEHVHLMPYLCAIGAELEYRDLEARGLLPLNLLLDDARTVLAVTPCTVQALARALSLPVPRAGAILRRLLALRELLAMETTRAGTAYALRPDVPDSGTWNGRAQ